MFAVYPVTGSRALLPVEMRSIRPQSARGSPHQQSSSVLLITRKLKGLSSFHVLTSIVSEPGTYSVMQPFVVVTVRGSLLAHLCRTNSNCEAKPRQFW